MADTIAPLQRLSEGLTTFQGVNLRKDRLSLRDEDVAKAINIDLHSQVGSALVRRGRTQVQSTLGAAIRLIQSYGGVRYAVAGTTLYRNGLSLVTGLDSALETTLASQRPLDDPSTWLFLADASGMQKASGSTVRTWGIAAPSTAPTLAAGAASALSGVYTVSYTFCRKNGSSLCHESNPSDTSSPITVSSTDISVSGLTDSSDAQVTHKRIYRTVNGGSVRLFDQEIAQGVTTATLSVADSALGDAVETDNDVPPTASWIVRHQEHMFFLDGHKLYWSKRYRPESVPTDNFLEIGTPDQPLVGLVSLVGLLGVFTAQTKYRVLGNATSGFVHTEALSSRGTPAPQAALVTEKGCFFPARDGLFRTNFVAEDEELTQLIAPLFEGLTVNDYAPINWDAASTMGLAYWKQRLYFSYPSGDNTHPDMLAVYSFHTNAWYFYQYDVPMQALYAEEETDYLLGGGADGTISALELGAYEGSAWILEPASRQFQTTSRKRFDFVRADTNGTVTFQVLIADLPVYYTILQGDRPRQLRRLGPVEGQEWRVRFSGTADAQVYGAEMYGVPLRPT
jgi:hypothetical protein